MSRIGRIHDDYYDPDKHLWPQEEGNEEDDNEPVPLKQCNRCKRDLEIEHQNGNPCDDVKFNYLTRGFCSCVCEAFDLRDRLKELGLFTDEFGLNLGANN